MCTIRRLLPVIVCAALLQCCGCDFLYSLLHKESAFERRLLGTAAVGEPNERTIEIQRLLKLYGYSPGTIDGKLGTKTRNAVERFQEDHELEATRYVDLETWHTLSAFNDNGLVVDGEVNMIDVQRALRTAGFSPGTIDGKRGTHTTTALKQFQQAHNLTVDGRIGYQTLRALADYVPVP